MTVPLERELPRGTNRVKKDKNGAFGEIAASWSFAL